MDLAPRGVATPIDSISDPASTAAMPEPDLRGERWLAIVIATYQERDFIGRCLDSVCGFEVPAGTRVEILVVDGMSDDGTREIVLARAAADPRVRLLDNPRRIQSSAVNLAIQETRAEAILWLGAHADYPLDYVVRTLEVFDASGADNVGGVVLTKRRQDTFAALLVQALTTHSFGVGDSSFRTHLRSGAIDTVPYGCFRRSIFERVGLFDERLVRAQDYEMNCRIRANGGRIWLDPAIRADYYQQPDLKSFLDKQFRVEAPYNAYMWYLAPYAFTPRHAVSAFFAAGVIGGLMLSPFIPWVQIAFLGVMALYFVLAVLSAGQQARRYRRPGLLLALPVAFFLFHFVHGLGVIRGLLNLAVGRAPVQNRSYVRPRLARSKS
ncbi:MAG TPA: glycosyltransferase family 2 protein [Gemmatimonadaceae bacterium]|nr:glycosyltransferase family 2 protein [Gemmatimonadaceae bacterium]